MQTAMDVYITIKPRVKSRELYERLKPYNVNVTDLGDKVYVYTRLTLKPESIDKVLSICAEYGDCYINAHTGKSPD